MIVLLIILAVLFLLAMLQVGIKLVYDKASLDAKIRVGFFKVAFPKENDNENKPPKEKVPKNKKKNPIKAAKTKSWLRTVWMHREEILTLLGRVLSAPTLDVLQFHIIVGAPDPETCALNYGKIQSAVGAALPVIENTIGIRKRKIYVGCDFMKEKTEIHAHAEITVRVFQIIAVAVVGLKLLIKLFHTQKSEFKAVLANESSSS